MTEIMVFQEHVPLSADCHSKCVGSLSKVLEFQNKYSVTTERVVVLETVPSRNVWQPRQEPLMELTGMAAPGRPQQP